MAPPSRAVPHRMLSSEAYEVRKSDSQASDNGYLLTGGEQDVKHQYTVYKGQSASAHAACRLAVDLESTWIAVSGLLSLARARQLWQLQQREGTPLLGAER